MNNYLNFHLFKSITDSNASYEERKEYAVEYLNIYFYADTPVTCVRLVEDKYSAGFHIVLEQVDNVKKTNFRWSST